MEALLQHYQISEFTKSSEGTGSWIGNSWATGQVRDISVHATIFMGNWKYSYIQSYSHHQTGLTSSTEHFINEESWRYRMKSRQGVHHCQTARFENEINTFPRCVDKPTRCNTSYEWSSLSIIWIYMSRTITSPSSVASSHKLYNALVCSCRRV